MSWSVFQNQNVLGFFLFLCAVPLEIGHAFKKVDDAVHDYLRNSVINDSSLVLMNDVCRERDCTDSPEWLGSKQNFSDYYRLMVSFPTTLEFLPIDSKDVDCAKHSQAVINNFQQLQLWALQMVDSSAKIPSGLLDGNANQLGNFDQCLNVDSEDGSFSGQYCLTALSITLPDTLKHLDPLIHSYYYMKSDLNDPGHRVPHFSTFDWALCVPSSCSSHDVERRVRKVLTNAANDLKEAEGLTIKVSVKQDMCQTRQQHSHISLTSPTVLFFLFFVFLCSLATILDYKSHSANPKKNELTGFSEQNLTWKILYAFSLRRNMNIILDIKPGPDEIPCIHGARFLGAFALLLGHKNMALLYSPFMNRNYMVHNLSRAWSTIGRTAIIYTDIFIFISGILTGINLLKQLDKHKRLNLFQIYFNRWFRFTPNLLVVILFSSFILPYLGSGPMWNLVITRHADLCESNAWRSLLYIHNYFGFENMCLTHTHQLGIDMQLFIISPLFIYCLWKWFRFGFFFSVFVAIASTVYRFYVFYLYKLTIVIIFGISVSQLFDVANLSYILPSHRVTTYIMGLLIAYYIHNRKEPLKISKGLLILGWFIAGVSGLAAFIGPYKMSYMDYVYNPFEGAIYGAFSPIAWGIFLTWTVVMAVNNLAGWFGDFLSWPYFKVFTQIAYAVYLTQFPIFFYNIGRIRTSIQYYPLMMIDIPEFSLIIFASLVLTLMFDLPCQHLRKILWQPVKSSYNKESVSIQSSTSSIIGDSRKLSQQEEVENNNLKAKHANKLD